MSNKLGKTIHLAWEYDEQYDPLKVGLVRIVRGLEPFTIDNYQDQTELTVVEYSPDFTSYVDNYELEEDTMYYYAIILHEAVWDSIMAISELQTAFIEKQKNPDFVFTKDSYSQTINLKISGTTEDNPKSSKMTIDWGDGEVTLASTSFVSHTYSEDISDAEIKVFLDEKDILNVYGIDGISSVDSWTVGSITTEDFSFGPLVESNSALQALPEILPETLTSLRGLVKDANNFNSPIGSWNVSKITDLSYAFCNATSFDQPLNDWDVREVVSMESTFENASSFNQDLDQWQTLSLFNVNNTFKNASSMEKDIHGWNTARMNVNNLNPNSSTEMAGIFGAVSNFAQGSNIPSYFLPKWAYDHRHHNIESNDNFIFTIVNTTEDSDWLYIWLTHHEQIPEDDSRPFEIYVNGKFHSGSTRILGPHNYLGSYYSISIELEKDVQYRVEVKGLVGKIRIQNDKGWWYPSDYENPTNTPAPITGEMVVEQWGAGNNIYNYILTTGTMNLTIPTVAPPITDFTDMFADASSFNDPNIIQWDMSGAICLSHMFAYAPSFNQPIGNWDVSNVTDFSLMFYSALNFNQDLSNWNVYNAVDMDLMFGYNFIFNTPIIGWKLGPYLEEAGIFGDSEAYNHSIDSWDLSECKSLKGLFRNASAFDQPLNNIDVSNIENFGNMFSGSSTLFNQPLDNWDVSNGKNFSSMFSNNHYFDQDISMWNTSNATNMHQMFYYKQRFNRPLVSWDTRKVTWEEHFYKEFGNSGSLQPVNYPLWGCAPISTNPDELAPPSDIEPIVYTTKGHTLTVAYAYEGLPSGCIIVDWGDGTITRVYPDRNDAERLGQYHYVSSWLHDYRDLSPTAEGTYTVKVYPCVPLKQYTFGASLEVISWGSQPVDSFMAVSTQGWNTSTTIKVPNYLPKFVTNLGGMFSGCSLFNDPNVISWDVSHVTKMRAVFSDATVFNQDITGWDVSNVTDFTGMFTKARAFNQAIGVWDVSSATQMERMFDSATEFNQPLANWNVSKVYNFTSMFGDSYASSGRMKFNQDISGWDVSSGQIFNSMFRYNPVFNQDLTNWSVYNAYHPKDPSNLYGNYQFNDESVLSSGNLPRFGSSPIKESDYEY